MKASDGKPYYHGLVSFALEQNHRLTEAETAAKRACECQLDDPWAHHAYAHALYALRKLQAGRELVEAYHTAWERCSPFMKAHNWFHAALFVLGATL